MFDYLTTKINKAKISLKKLIKRQNYIDTIIIITIITLLISLCKLYQYLINSYQSTQKINTSISSLPKYILYSTIRSIAAYIISLTFTICYSFWSVKDKYAERILIPLVDILQSIPVLAFMPITTPIIISFFGYKNVGLEIGSIFLIFTSQVWNLIISLYQSFKGVPKELQEVGTAYNFNYWQRLKWIELPFGITGLAWNSIISVASGWFFLIVCETFKFGDNFFQIPGIGSYIYLATEQSNTKAIYYSILSMMCIIIILDQLLWNPILSWAEKFRTVDIANKQYNSWFLTILRRSNIIKLIAKKYNSRYYKTYKNHTQQTMNTYKTISHITITFLLLILFSTIVKMLHCLIISQDKINWIYLIEADVKTLLRVFIAIILSTLWTVPIGIIIGKSKNLLKIIQPIIQISASFPATMVFPLIILSINHKNIVQNMGCIILMLLGVQWYILFNIIAGTRTISKDLLEVANSFQLSTWQKFKHLYLPTILPHLITGWITASGGAWNASIIAEYYTDSNTTFKIHGIGSVISDAAYNKNYTILIASVLIMSTTILVINKLIWKPLYTITQTRYTPNE